MEWKLLFQHQYSTIQRFISQSRTIHLIFTNPINNANEKEELYPQFSNYGSSCRANLSIFPVSVFFGVRTGIVEIMELPVPFCTGHIIIFYLQDRNKLTYIIS